MKLKRPAFRFPIRYKLVVLSLTVALLPLSIASILARNNVQRVEHRVAEASRTTQQARTSATARALDDQLQALIAEANVAAALPELREFAAGGTEPTGKERARAVLSALAKKDASHESVALVGLDGLVLASSAIADEGASVSSQASFQEALKGNGTLSDVALSATTGRPVVYASAPVRSAGGVALGVVRMQIDLGGVTRQVAGDAASYGAGAAAMLVDENGLRLALSDPQANRAPRDGGQLLAAMTDVPETTRRQWAAEGRFGASAPDLATNADPELWGAIGSGQTGATRVRHGGREEDVAYASLTVKPWRYVASAPGSTVTAATDATMSGLNQVWLFAASAAALVALLFSMTITRPLVRLARVADDVSMGDTNVTVDIGSNDEIGDLASAFARTVASIRYYMRRSANPTPPDDPKRRYDQAA